MNNRIEGEYYTTRKPELLKVFDEESQYWGEGRKTEFGWPPPFLKRE
jgi:hypothetical protein